MKTMKMDEITRLAVKKIVEQYDPHTVIVYGSRARGDATADSDIDIACFMDNPTINKEAKLFRGHYLDLWIYSTDLMNTACDQFYKLEGGYCAVDKCGKGSDLLVKINNKIKKGPVPLSQEDKGHRIEWAFKMLNRALTGDIEGNYRRLWLQFDLLESYFLLRDLWYFGPKRSFSWLKVNDQKAYRLFSNVYKNPENMELLKSLVSYVARSGSVQH